MFHTLQHLESSPAVEDCVRAIHALQTDNGTATTTTLAGRLGVTPGSASAMVKRLAELGLVDHAPYRGAVLTPTGTRAALEVTRHHRLLETFLAQELGMPWEQVHAEADRLEHVLSEELEALIAAKLGDPDHDPHGAPIPSRDLELPLDTSVRLGSLAVGATGTLTRVSDADPEMLRYLGEHGIGLGDAFEIVDRQPFGGPVLARFGETVHPLGDLLADAMWVEVA